MQRLAAGLDEPNARLGRIFEDAVGKRLWLWIAAHDGFGIVQSVWRNVQVCRQAAPGLKVAEFDHLLVLKNGILLHIECKTATASADQKELDARLLNLQRAGSQLAKMALCAPLFTEFSGDDWFRSFHDLKQRVEDLGQLAFLPLTLDGQPTRYTCPGRDGNGGCDYSCLPFEEEVEKFVAPYRPRAQASLALRSLAYSD